MPGFDTYVQANHDRGCCIDSSQNGAHQRCICEHIHEKDQCQEICSTDRLCKGFAILFKEGHYDPAICQIATSVDECPTNCRGPHNVGNVAPLDPDGQCGSINVWEGGCYIKQGMYAKMSSVAFSMRNKKIPNNFETKFVHYCFSRSNLQ